MSQIDISSIGHSDQIIAYANPNENENAILAYRIGFTIVKKPFVVSNSRFLRDLSMPVWEVNYDVYHISFECRMMRKDAPCVRVFRLDSRIISPPMPSKNSETFNALIAPFCMNIFSATNMNQELKLDGKDVEYEKLNIRTQLPFELTTIDPIGAPFAISISDVTHRTPAWACDIVVVRQRSQK